MFLSRELNVISGKKSISAKQLNGAIDAVGLPFGFQYSKRFLLYGIRTVHQVEVCGTEHALGKAWRHHSHDEAFIGDKTYRVPSESKAGLFYNVSLDPLSCECPAFYRFKVTPYPFCKHIVAAMVKVQDVTDAFFDWLIEKDNSDVGDMDEYIQARFQAGTASTSILEPLPELPIIPSFSWEVAYKKCFEVVGKKAIVNVLIDDLVNWGKLRKASLGEYNRAEWILIYDFCKKEASIMRDPKSLNNWSYNSAVFIERCNEVIADRRRRVRRRFITNHNHTHRTLVREIK